MSKNFESKSSKYSTVLQFETTSPTKLQHNRNNNNVISQNNNQGRLNVEINPKSEPKSKTAQNDNFHPLKPTKLPPLKLERVIILSDWEVFCYKSVFQNLLGRGGMKVRLMAYDKGKIKFVELHFYQGQFLLYLKSIK